MRSVLTRVPRSRPVVGVDTQAKELLFFFLGWCAIVGVYAAVTFCSWCVVIVFLRGRYNVVCRVVPRLDVTATAPVTLFLILSL